MKLGFIGTGRMGQAMVRRLLEAKHEVGVYNRTPEKAKPLAEAGAQDRRLDCRRRALRRHVYTMLADDAALEDVLFRQGLLDALPKGSIHVCAGTHGIPVIRKLKAAHAEKGHILIARRCSGGRSRSPAALPASCAAGPADALAKCKPLFEAMSRRVFEGGVDPEAAAAIKLANNFVLGCAMEAMGEGFSLTRKYGVETSVFYDVMTDGLFNCPAYKVYGKIMVDESYAKVGQMAVLGLKDANLALEAGSLAAVPLPSGNVWRDRLVGAVAHGDGDKDWAVWRWSRRARPGWRNEPPRRRPRLRSPALRPRPRLLLRRQAKLAQDLLVVLAERRRARIDARPAVGEGKRRQAARRTRRPFRLRLAWRWMTPRLAICGSAIASPMVRTRAAGTCRACRNSSHSSAVRVSMISSSTAISRSWSASRSSLVLLDHVRPLQQRPQPRCWRRLLAPSITSPSLVWNAPLVACGCRLPCGLGCTPLRR